MSRRFGRLTAVARVSLSVDAGEFFTLVGPSGGGKTTLLRMIAGFEDPDEGDLLLDDPLAALDAKLREQITAELIALPRRSGSVSSS